MYCRQFVAFIVVFVALGSSEVHAAGPNPTEEAAIRKLIAEVDVMGNRGVSLPDFVFWSGAYKQPVVGHEDDKPKQEAGEGSISDRAAGTQKLRTVPVRIVVSDSQDLAYEYSTFSLEFATKAGKQIKLNGGVLRVWQKQGGEWKQAADFARGYDQ